MKSKNFVFLVVVLGCLGSVALGLRYWRERREVFMGRLERPAKFLLVGIDGALFDSARSSALPLQLYIFMANDIQREDMTRIAEFWPQFDKTWGPTTELILVSRVNEDLLVNFKNITKFPGKILSDPTGSAGRLFGFWQNIAQDDGWHYVLLSGKDATKVWALDVPKSADFSEIKAKIQTALSATSVR